MFWFSKPRRSFNSINRQSRRRMGHAAQAVAVDALKRSGIGEHLESRRMLVTYTGTVNPDTFLIQVGGGNVTVTINGTPDVRADAAVATIVIDALGGNDTITLLNNDTTNPTTINAGDGVDSIIIGGGNYTGNIDSTVVITDGTVGTTGDVVTFNDVSDVAGNDTYTMTAIRTFVKPTSQATTWSGMENIVVNGSPIASTYDVRTDGASSLGGTTINGGAAADTISVGNGLDLGNAIDANLVINGGAGTDSVTLDDTTETSATTYTMDINGIGSTQMGGSIRISFSSITNMTLNGATGALNDTYNVTDLNGVSFATVNGGDGNDTLNYGDGVLDTNLIDVSMNFAGGLGVDRLNYNGQNFSGAETYTITSTTIDTSLSGLLTYGTTVEAVAITADNGATTFNVNSTSLFATMSIDGGDGDDTVNVGNGDFVTNVNNDITVTGGGGNDLLNLDDSSTAVGRSWNYQFGSIGTPGDTVFYTTLFSSNATERISVSGGTGTDTFTIPSSSILTSATLNGGGGNDTFTVASGGDLDTIDGAISIVGGVGIDSVTLNDTTETLAEAYNFASTGFTAIGMANPTNFSSDTETVTLDAAVGVFAQTFNVDSVSDITTLIINAGDGNDTANIGAGNWGSNVLSAIDFNGALGIDRINIDDSTDTLDTYTLEAGRIVSADSGLTDDISWTSTESVSLLGSSGGDTFNVTSMAVADNVTLNGGAGNDTLTTTTSPEDLDNTIVGDLFFTGGIDTDLITLADSEIADGGENYTIAGTFFDKTAGTFGSLSYSSNVELLNFTLDDDNSLITIGQSFSSQSLTVNGGAGNDTFVNDAGNDWTSDWDGDVSLSGGSGVNDLVLNNTLDAASNTYLMDASDFQSTAGDTSGLVRYLNIQNVTWTDGTGASTFNIEGLGTAIDNFTLNGGDGNDTINVGGTAGTDLDDTNTFQNALLITLLGGLGTDSLSFRDTDNDVGDDTYLIDDPIFTVAPGAATVVNFNYSGMEGMNVEGANIAHTYNIEDTAFATNVTGGTGNDNFIIAPTGQQIDALAATTIVGGGGSDTITANDESDLGADTYTFTANFFSKSAFTGLRYTDVDRFNLDANGDDNIILVSNTDVGTVYDLNAGVGNDTFNVSNTGGVGNILGNVTLLGSTGTDTVTYNDSLSAVTGTYNIGGVGLQRVQRVGTAEVVVGVDNESVTIQTSAGNNTINWNSWNALFPGTPTLIAGLGNDTINIGNGDYDSNIGKPLLVNTGAGNDSLVFNDSADNDVGDTYTLSSSSITDGGAVANVLNYVADIFDTVVLLLPGGNEVVNVTGSISGTTSISGGAGNDTVNAGNGDLDLLDGTLVIDGGADSDRFNLDNSLDAVAGSNTINIVALSPTLGQLTNIDQLPNDIAQWTNTVEVVVVTDSAANTTFNVTSLPSPVRTSINGGDGNDTFNAGGGDIDLNLAGGVGPIQRFEGGNGVDILNFDDSTDDAGGDVLFVNSTSIEKNGQVVNYGTMEAMNIAGSPQPTEYNIGSINATTPTSIAGGAGNDTFNVGSDIDGGLLGATTLTGNGGVDRLTLNDTGDTADADAYNFAVAGPFDTFNKTGAALLSYSVENAVLDANGGNNVITVNAKSAALGLTLNGNSGDDSLAIADGGTSANPIVFTTGIGADTIDVDSDNDAVEAFARFAGTDEVARLRVGAGSTLRNAAGNSTIVVTSTMSIGGALDLDAGFFIGRVGVFTAGGYNTVLTNGRNGGLWNGASQSFSSTTANATARPDGLGIRLATDPNLPGANIITFGGQAVNPGDTCIAYVQNGDTDLDRDVDFDDLLRVAQNYNQVPPRGWTQGSFDYDSDVDFDDLLATAQNYGLPFLTVSPSKVQIDDARNSLAQASKRRGMSPDFTGSVGRAMAQLERGNVDALFAKKSIIA